MGNTISTKQEHWQAQCLSCAQEKQPFVLTDVAVKHHLFIHNFCLAHPYRFKAQDTNVIFMLSKEIKPFSYKVVSDTWERAQMLDRESHALKIEMQDAFEEFQVRIEEARQIIGNRVSE